MKQKASILLIFLLVISMGLEGYALQIPGYEGGIQNERIYQEVIFVTGEPIVVEGTLTINDRNDRITYSYRNLTNKEKTVTMTRNVTLEKTVKEFGKDQREESLTLTRYKETINANGVRYETDDKSYQWSQSTIHHNKPGVTYFAGNWDGRKVYTINKNQGTVMVDTQGTLVGYDHYWGTTETQTISHYIQYERNEGNNREPVKWEGTVEVDVANNRTKNYHYEANMPTQISFRGGYLLTEQQENVLKYSYDLPRVDGQGNPLRGRNIKTNSTTLDTNPINQRLTIPAMRDIGGHWAEKDILLLASLEAISPKSTNFGPSLPMSRGEFAKAIAKVMGVEKQEEKNTKKRSRQPVVEPEIFVDVPKVDPNQQFIEAVYEKGIMEGIDQNYFKPNEPLTRAQAAVVLIKALGFEGLAPIQQYSTGFMDDRDIPIWARDAVYLARELNFIHGTSDGYFHPNATLTKGEAASMLTNYIQYLQKDLRYDYRERILNF